MTALSASTEDLTRQAGRRASWAIVLLAALYIMSLLDRQILSLLIGPIKAEFSLSDVHIGVLLGTSFGLAYSILGVPAARFADSGNRRFLIFAGVAVWGLSTLASSFATSFGTLLMLRLGLAAGEAVLTPTAHSLIGDLFPPEKRSLAASIFSAAGLAGAPITFFGGAMAIQSVESALKSGWSTSFDVWQIVLFVVALPSLFLGVLFLLTVREPARVAHPGREHAVSAALLWRQFNAHRKLYIGLMVGAALGAGASTAVVNWAVEFLKRDFGWTAVQGGWGYGSVGLLAGLGGPLLAPWLSRQLFRRGRADAVILVSAGFGLVGLCGLGLGPVQHNVWAALALICIGQMGVFGTCMNVVVSMQEVAPARMRATFVAVLFLFMNLFGLGVGPVGVPLIGEWLSPGSGHLGAALAVFSIVVLVPSLTALLWVRRDYAEQAQLGFPQVEDLPPADGR